MKTLLLLAAAFSILNCKAQTPAVVKESFAKFFPNTTVKKWDKEDGNYEANFNKDGKTMSATFDAKGTWMETETGIAVNELPASVKDFLKTNYAGAAIKEASIITSPQNKKIYEAEVKGKDLQFDEKGNFLKEETD